MTKRTLGQREAEQLRLALQFATLDALMASRRWQPGELVFQGGTSLHLVHGSPRFSEDLDFLVSNDLRLNQLAGKLRAQLGELPWAPPDLQLSVRPARDDARNPYSLAVTLSGREVIGSVRVKLELWRTAEGTLEPLSVLTSTTGPTRGPMSRRPLFVPTASLKEIHADKVFALAARPYLKARDIFDLHWIAQTDPQTLLSSALALRLDMYPSQTAPGWLQQACDRLLQLDATETAERVLQDLRQWLPSSFPLSNDLVADMLESTRRALKQGIDLMQTLNDQQDGSNAEADKPT